jgi:hypothetical protein
MSDIDEVIQAMRTLGNKLTAMADDLEAAAHGDQRQAWAKALSAKSADQRRRGHRKLPPDITGIRKPPPAQ